MSVRRVTLLVLGLVSLLVGCGKPALSPATPAPISVRTAPVVREKVLRPIRAAGRLGGKQEMALAFRTAGTVDRLLVREGQTVRRGQVLATLDTLDADAVLVQARAAHEKAERDRARIAGLASAGAAARVSLQDAETAVELTSAALRQARHARVVSEIRAPDDGQVQRRLVEAHEQVGAGTPVFLMRGATRGWVVKLGLSDRDAVQVRIGDAATVRFDAFPDRTFSARVTEIAGGASPQTGTFEVEVSVDPGRSQPPVRPGGQGGGRPERSARAVGRAGGGPGRGQRADSGRVHRLGRGRSGTPRSGHHRLHRGSPGRGARGPRPGHRGRDRRRSLSPPGPARGAGPVRSAMGLAAFSVRRWQFTVVVFGMLAALGGSSLLSIPKAEDPSFPYPNFSVVVVYPGAVPTDLEKLVVDPIEAKLKASTR